MSAGGAVDSFDAERRRTATEIRGLHIKRGDAWLRRDAEGYLSFYWDDALIFAVDSSSTVAEIRRAVESLLKAGGGPLTIDLPPADDIVISPAGDAATTGFTWRTCIRAIDGLEYDRTSYETNVWYRRNGVWKIIRMHLTRISYLRA